MEGMFVFGELGVSYVVLIFCSTIVVPNTQVRRDIPGLCQRGDQLHLQTWGILTASRYSWSAPVLKVMCICACCTGRASSSRYISVSTVCWTLSNRCVFTKKSMPASHVCLISTKLVTLFSPSYAPPNQSDPLSLAPLLLKLPYLSIDFIHSAADVNS